MNKYLGKNITIYPILAISLIGLNVTSQSWAFTLAKSINNIDYANLSPGDLMQQGKDLYEAGKLDDAVKILQKAVTGFAATGDKLNQAMALNNLALVYKDLGEWNQAETAIKNSFNLLENSTNLNRDRRPYLAQAFDVRGGLELTQGQAEKAIDTWQKSEAIYQEIGDNIGLIRSHINQAQALQFLGLYRRALKTLQEVSQLLKNQPDSIIKATGLRSLGDTLRVVGNLEESEKILQQSLQISQTIKNRDATAKSFLSLGNTIHAQRNKKSALTAYEKAAETAILPLTKLQAYLNQLSILVEEKQWSEATKLLELIQPQLTNLPKSRPSIYGRINLAYNLMQINLNNFNNNINNENNLASYSNIAQQLAIAIQDAKILGDKRAESYAIGNLAKVYEKTQQWQEAQKLTEEALAISQSINAPDIAYQWQWQLGRLLKNQKNQKEAIASYSQAVATLKSLRSDLVAVNPDVQFSFRESVEPVYRELVGLLLEDGASEENLIKARNSIESLQLAELDNFFREACLDAKPEQIDRVDSQAAVIYPIILADRLEIILSIPGKPLRNYTVNVSQQEVEKTIDLMVEKIASPSSRKTQYLPINQTIYNWLIRPLEADLANTNVKTLVFVPDGAFRNIPMGSLYDGKQFLIEKYAIALTPGLQLLPSQPLGKGKLQVLTGGISEARSGFSALPFVKVELNQIKSEIATKLLLDQNFTTNSIKNAINSTAFPVVHLATHGQFSSKSDETFILTWDNRLNINQINELLRNREQEKSNPIELLVLSACQTATGDKRAALGLAGVAVRAGARSTLATLWSVSDEATAALMTEFYRQLNDRNISKSEALRRAQVALLKKPQFQHTRFWAPYILVGNWR